MASQSTDFFRGLFREKGKLDILHNYRGQVRKNQSVTSVNAQFLLICGLWFGIVLSIATALSYGCYTVLPFILQWLSGILTTAGFDVGFFADISNALFGDTL